MPYYVINANGGVWLSKANPVTFTPFKKKARAYQSKKNAQMAIKTIRKLGYRGHVGIRSK